VKGGGYANDETNFQEVYKLLSASSFIDILSLFEHDNHHSISIIVITSVLNEATVKIFNKE
jgi:hypothetical protein